MGCFETDHEQRIGAKTNFEKENGVNEYYWCMGNEEKIVHTVYLDDYYIDQYEVTVNSYKKCVNSGRCEIANKNFWVRSRKENIGIELNGKFIFDDGGSWENEMCNYDQSSRGDHPINCVDWYNAKKYCEFVGKRLPTEAEWEKAASWKNNRKNEYSTGKNSFTCQDLVTGCSTDSDLSTRSIGSKPKEINGTYDMAGNVVEWVYDWYGKDYYKKSQRNNPKGPASGITHVKRGGDFLSTINNYSTNRAVGYPKDRIYDLGFRCAVSPLEE